ncbi:MAG TPA: hypothetical protein VNC79_09030, partial [Mycobacteriales bacterium]|nr:hypothetical protein [Mycobacteriales bacterium]
MLAPQAGRPGDHQQLLVVEVARPLPGVQPRQPGLPVGVVDRAAVVGVDEGQVGELAALVDVRDAGHGQPQQLLGEHVGAPRRGQPVDERGDVGDDNWLGEHLLGEVAHCVVVLGVRLGPGGASLGLAGRLLEVGRQPAGVDRPGADQRLPQQVLGVRVQHGRPQVRGGRAPPGDLVGPLLRQLGEAREPGPDVLAALGVVSGQGGHRVRPGRELPAAPGVQLVDRHAQVRGVAADLVERRESQPAVERGVLDALGHHRAAGLLEPDHELVPVRAAALVAQRQLHQQVEGALPVLGQPIAGHSGGRADDLAALGRRGLAGHDVRPVDRDRDEQLHQRLADAAP